MIFYKDRAEVLIVTTEAVIGFGYIIGPVFGTVLLSFGGYKCVFLTLDALYVPLVIGVLLFLSPKYDGIFETQELINDI